MGLSFSALEIGQGDAFLLEKDGWKCLFDSGGSKKGLVSILKNKNINHLNLAICSHNDLDHTNGFIGILDSNIKVDEIWLPGLFGSIMQFVIDNGIPKEIIYLNDEEPPISYENFRDNSREITNPENYFRIDSLYNINERSIKSDDFEDNLNKYVKYIDYILHDIDKIDFSSYEDFLYPVRKFLYNLYNKYSCYINDHYHDIDEIDFSSFNVFLDHDSEFLYEFYKKFSRYKNNFYNRHEINHSYFDVFLHNEFYKIFLRYYNYFYNRHEIDHKHFKAFLQEESCYIDMLYKKYLLNFHYNSKNLCCNFKQLSPIINLKNIMKIATLAYKHGCIIKWFEPIESGTKYDEIDYGFKALNSKPTLKIKKLKDVVAFMYALKLTEENKYSLVFEYTVKNNPIIRFSADSDSTCQSVKPYTNNIIITAPHHGSEANQNVYKDIKGNDIIWVRSDRKSSQRPCSAFKNQQKRYCLACRNKNFKRELRFEFQENSWQHIDEDSCTCK